MKLMIASDIHGSAKYCEKMLERFEKEGASRLALLGDLLYHGPRNDLPEEYAPKRVIALLNGAKDSLFCVRGNCDAEVDQMVLEFPIMADCALWANGQNVIYMTHGHHTSPSNPPPMKKGDILLFGHTHIPQAEARDGVAFMNPGSVSLPKNGSPRSYIVLEDGLWQWKALDDGGVFCEYLDKTL